MFPQEVNFSCQSYQESSVQLTHADKLEATQGIQSFKTVRQKVLKPSGIGGA